jgi:hypothetical protein
MGKGMLTLRLVAAATGPFLDTLAFTSDDPANPDVRIPIRGFGRQYFAVIDDRDSTAYRESGAWSFSNAQAYGSTSRYAYPGTDVSASFTVTLKKKGFYEIAEIVPKTVNASQRALYRLRLGYSTMDSVFIDQNLGSGGWVTLMNDIIPADSEITLLVTDAMSPVVAGLVLRADAVRFQWLQEGTEAVGISLADIPTSFRLLQNYPNPFNGVSNFGYRVSVSSIVTLKVYDLLGREVAVLVNGQKAPGNYSVRWDAPGIAGGVYFCRMQAGGFLETIKLLLVR